MLTMPKLISSYLICIQSHWLPREPKCKWQDRKQHVYAISRNGFEKFLELQYTYCQTSYISRTLVGNKIVDHSDIVTASSAGAALTTSAFST